jgi:hypothetical protein
MSRSVFSLTTIEKDTKSDKNKSDSPKNEIQDGGDGVVGDRDREMVKELKDWMGRKKVTVKDIHDFRNLLLYVDKTIEAETNVQYKNIIALKNFEPSVEEEEELSDKPNNISITHETSVVANVLGQGWYAGWYAFTTIQTLQVVSYGIFTTIYTVYSFSSTITFLLYIYRNKHLIRPILGIAYQLLSN